MPILEFNVMGQCIRRADKIVPVAKNRNYFKAKFNFESDEWTGTKTALFIRGSYSKSQVLDSENMCDVPWEFFDTDTNACGYVSIYCGDLVTTNKEMVKILASGYRESDASVPPTPDVYQQILGEMDKKLDKSGHTPNKYLGTDDEGNVVDKEGSAGGGSGTTDYNDLENKPRINGTELSGDKTLEELGIQQKGEYALKEEIPISLPASDVYDWAKQPQKPTYTATEVGAESKGSVNTHDVSDTAHSDIRSSISGLTEKLNSLANSDDETLDQMSEIVAYIKNNKTLIDGITTGKISTSDIVNNLVTNVTTKVLSAAQGVELKRQIDEVVKSIPKKLPNPHKLTFEGAVTAEYDGSSEITVMIPDTNGKLDKNQGVENAGKALVIGPDGNVLPGEVQGGGDGIAIINTMSGENPLVITDSAKRKVEEFGLDGKSEQLQTTGAQLCDASGFDGMQRESVIVSVEDGKITATGTVQNGFWMNLYVPVEEYKERFKPGEKIYIKCNKTKDCNYDFAAYGGFGNPILGTVTEENSINGVTLPSEMPKNDRDFYFLLNIPGNTTLKGSVKPIVYHTGDGTYEPYTGGNPSPSSDYPQEIKNVGKYNEETGKYEVDAEFSANLFDISKVQNTSELINNGDGTLTLISKTSSGKSTLREICPDLIVGETYILKLDTEGLDYIYCGIVWSSGTSKQITQAMLDSILYFYNNNKPKVTIKNIQINRGSTVIPYSTYRTPQSVKITSDRPITKWDRLVEQDGQIGWLYQSARMAINGTNLKWAHSNKPENIYFATTIEDAFGGKGASFCNTYRNIQDSAYSEKYAKELCIYGDHPTSFVGDKAFRAPNETITTLEQWKEWITENPIEMIYHTKNQEFVPLAEEEQDAIRALKTYYPTTVISTDGGEVDPDIEVNYVADTKNYIDNKVAANVANIISQYQINISNLLSLMPMETQATMIENDTNNILESEVTQ